MRGRRRPPGTVAVWVSADGTRRFYARQGRRWGLSILAWVVAVTALLGPAAEFEFYDSPRIGVPFVVAVLVAAVWVTYALLRCGIRIEPGLLTNRRMLWTNRVPVGDIARFDPPARNSIRHPGIRIVLRDGRILSATAFTRSPYDNDTVGVAECAELNAWLQTRAGAHVAPSLY